MLIKEALDNAYAVAWSVYSDTNEVQRKIEAAASANGWSMAKLGGKKLAYLKDIGAPGGEVSDADAAELEVWVREWAKAEAESRAAASVVVLGNEWDGVKKWADDKVDAATWAWTKVMFKIKDTCGT